MSGGPDDGRRPRLASKARLRWDRQAGRYLLLYPERGLLLSRTAADVVQLCTGENTVPAIVDRLAERHPDHPRAVIEAEVRAFLGALADRGLLDDGAAGGNGASGEGAG